MALFLLYIFQWVEESNAKKKGSSKT